MWQERQNEVLLDRSKFRRNAHGHAQQGQQEQDEECQDFSAAGRCHAGPCDESSNQHDAEGDQREQ